MQKINRAPFVYLEPKVDSLKFLKNDSVFQKKDNFLNLTNLIKIGVGQSVSNRINFSHYIIRFYEIEFTFQIRSNEHTIKLSQIVSSALMMAGAILILHGL